MSYTMQGLQQSLEKLHELYANDVITQFEYDTRRKALVDGFVGVPPVCEAELPLLNYGGQSQGGGYAMAAGSSQNRWALSREDRELARLKHGSSTVKVQPVPSRTSDEVLAMAFAKFGEVQSTAVKQGSPTYGYVNFLTPEAAQAAAAARKVEVGGAACTVSLAKRRKGQQTEAPPSNGIGLFNLPYCTTHDELYAVLSQYEGFQAVKMVYKKSGEFRGYAFAYFDSVDSATVARELLAGLILGDQKVDIKFSNQSLEEALASSPTYPVP